MYNKILLFLLLAVIKVSRQASWSPPYFDEVKGVEELKKTNDNNNKVELHLHENVPVEFILGDLTASTDVTPVMDRNDYFELVVLNGRFQIKTKKEIDYEKITKHTFFVQQSTVGVEFIINVVNLNDNEIIVRRTSTDCAIKENLIGESSCIYEVSDKDGISEFIEIDINEDVSDKFAFNWVGNHVGLKEANILLSTQQELDYEKNTIFVFDFILRDEIPKNQAKSTAVLDVIDEPDEKPKWINIFSSQQFDENKPQEFYAAATDGDYGIKSPIKFECIDESTELNGLLHCEPSNIELPNYQVKIIVDSIDREQLKSDTLEFTLRATEVQQPHYFIEQKINLIIKDVNDNIPEITLSHHNELQILENTFTKLDDLIKITIEDKDLADFGTYTVELSSSTINVTNIFQIIPDSGYQKTSFALALINFAELDYDRKENMRNFTLKVKAIEKVKSVEKEIAEEIRISLINWNDEKPIFKEAKHKIQILETVGRKAAEKLNTTDLYATDDDVFCDSLSYELLGIISKTLIYKNNDLVTIYPSSQKQIFDYETQINHYFQLEAHDNFTCDTRNIVNRAYAEIEIELLDVNDEPPTLIINQQYIPVPENSVDGTLISTIKASDPDTKNKLKIDIDWTKTTATKDRTDFDFTEYHGCFTIDDCTPSSNEIVCNLKLKEVKKNNTPDFEKFDTINLHVYVIDENQIEGTKNDDTATLIINVQDVNDCPPEFTKETIESTKRVLEESSNSTIITIIRATDNDTKSDITYSITPENDGLVKIDPKSGEISVAGRIDAEAITGEYLNYTVSADDTLFKTDLMISIYVVDKNDNPPTFKVIPEDYDELFENVEKGTKVVKIQGIDADRDDPNNLVTYAISRNDYFAIDRQSGQITVSQDGLDREEQEVHDITVTINDNPVDSVPLEVSATFRIILQDENDNDPKIITEQISASESVRKGEEIDATIKAQDIDKENTTNSKIQFKLKSLVSRNNEGNPKLSLSDFEMQDKKNGEIAIKTKIDLRKYFGNYLLEVYTNDLGTPQRNDTKTIVFIIKKYAFDPPQFAFPKNNDKILLKKNQQIGRPLIKYDNNQLENIEAFHDERDRLKYNITFEVQDPSNTFRINTLPNNQAELVLNSLPNNKLQYEIKIIATDDEKKQSEVSVSVRFVDEENPYFEGDRKHICSFTEAEEGLEKGETCILPKAIYGEEINLPIYYLIYEDKNSAFKSIKNSDDFGVLSLTKPIYLENYTDYLVVQASQSENPTLIPKEDSLLQVKINLIDVNNHAPEFQSKNYAKGIMVGERTDIAILTVKAEDKDPSDKLEYFMEPGSFEAIGDRISEGTFTVKVNGEVMQNFQVQANMNGYFQFNVIVNDTRHTDKAKVKIFVITDKHVVPLFFRNTTEEVKSKQKELKESLTKVINEEFVSDAVLDFECSIQSIEKAPVEGSDGKLDDDRTVVKAHFVNNIENIAMESDEVKRIFNKPEVLVNLVSSIRRVASLDLDDYVETIVADNSKMLMAWLIGNTVVLGSLCVLLIVAFIIKNRSWNRRLDKLTTVKFDSQESKLNIAAPPTTNRRAVEGSNPVFNISDEADDYKRNSTFDDVSMSSGDSDLVGVENNPAFMQ